MQASRMLPKRLWGSVQERGSQRAVLEALGFWHRHSAGHGVNRPIYSLGLENWPRCRDVTPNAPRAHSVPIQQEKQCPFYNPAPAQSLTAPWLFPLLGDWPDSVDASKWRQQGIKRQGKGPWPFSPITCKAKTYAMTRYAASLA